MLGIFVVTFATFAAEPDKLLGYAIGQPTSTLSLKRSPQGAYKASGVVAGEQGSLFIVPCGTRVHELIFQVMAFVPSADVDPAKLDPAIRLVPDPRSEARRIRLAFEGALQAAGWTRTSTKDLGSMATATFLRNGVERTVNLGCEPENPSSLGGPEACRVSINAGGAEYCTDGL